MMQTIESALRKERKQLEKIVEEAGIRLKTAPTGRLRIQKKRGRIEYYYKNDDSDSGVKRDNFSSNKVSCEKTGHEKTSCDKPNSYSNGRYMKKNERNLAQGIAQRDHDIQVIKNAEERIKAIDTFLVKYKKTSLDDIYEKTNQCRRELISAPVISDSEFVKRWQSVQYEGKAFPDEPQEIITERGERVRSKSEKIIADKLYALGIPYRYEYPLILDGNIKIYPDFTILKMPAREEVYLEHLGMMDDTDYVDTVIYKFNTYERSGIYIGVNLFITYETSKKSLNTRALDKLMKKLFCVERE